MLRILSDTSWTSSTSGSEPEVGVHLDVDGFYCTCALEPRGKSKPFQKRQLLDGLIFPTVGSLGRGSAEQSGWRCVRLPLSKVATLPCSRKLQATPVSGCVAGLRTAELARKLPSGWQAVRATWRGCRGAASSGILMNHSPFQSQSLLRELITADRRAAESWLSRADWLAIHATAVCEEDKLPPLLITHKVSLLDFCDKTTSPCSK